MSPKVLALLLLMIGSLFLAFQYRQKSSQNLVENFYSPRPNSSGQVAAAKIEVISPSPWVVEVPSTSPSLPKITTPSPAAKSIQTNSSNTDNYIYPNSSIN